MLEQLINFLRTDLDISMNAIALAKRTPNIELTYPAHSSLAVWILKYKVVGQGISMVRSILSKNNEQ